MVYSSGSHLNKPFLPQTDIRPIGMTFKRATNIHLESGTSAIRRASSSELGMMVL